MIKLLAGSFLALLLFANAAQALQCTRSDGSKFSCFCDDQDGQKQFPAKCSERSRGGTTR
jgi:hypothetical protein